MNLLIKNARIVDPQSEFNGKQVDIRIENGIIQEIGKGLSGSGEVIDTEDTWVSPGWMDMLANFRDPGLEYKETIESGIACARKGGFTAVCLSPYTTPRIASKAQIKYILNKAVGSGVNLYPLGNLSEDGKGENISEMFDMLQAGAVAFTDDKQHVNAGLMSRALLYSNNFNGLIMSFPFEPSFGSGQINEGEASVMTGLKPIPAVSEELQISRDLYLAEYNESRIHFNMISSERSVELIREAKKKGLRVSCGVSFMHLLHTESDLLGFDVNFKLLPPLRTERDRQALWEGLKDRTIDVIVSDHSPEDVENKKVEFDRAAFGTTGLEILFAALNQSGNLDDSVLYNALVSNPRRILGKDVPTIKTEQPADITVFSRSLTWTYDTTASLSENTPFFGKTFKGGVLTTVLK